MTKTEALIYSILAPTRKGVPVLACAVDVTAHLLFVERRAMDDIQVTKDVYPMVAKRAQQKPDATSRQIERLANACWDEGDREYLDEVVIGRTLKDIRRPSDLLFYLAVRVHTGQPFFKVIEKHPELLF